jgi:hypothetical protein
VLTWNGSQWTAQEVSVSVDVDGETILINDDGQLTANNTAALWNANKLCGTELDCETLEALGEGDNGKVLTWNGSQWTAQEVSVSVDVDGETILINDDGQLTANNTAALWNANKLCGTELDCETLEALGADDNGKVLTWNGSQWTAQEVSVSVDVDGETILINDDGQLTANNTAALWNANKLCGTELDCETLEALGRTMRGWC